MTYTQLTHSALLCTSVHIFNALNNIFVYIGSYTHHKFIFITLNETISYIIFVYNCIELCSGQIHL